MNIAELFVNVGVKGADKTVGALGEVKKGLGDLASSSLATKAAIVGAMYALERLFAKSGQAGTDLTNFNALTGLSAKQLQQWQFAARQAGVANEDFTGTLKGVQTSMTNMLLGKGAPEGLALLASKVGFDAKRARDTFYVMQQLQKFAQNAPADVGNAVIKSFGVSEGVIAAMRRGAFNEKSFSAAPTYSDKEVGQLDKANIAWSNLGTKIEMAFGHFNAMHGGQLVKDISMIVDKVILLTEALVKLGDKFHVFTLIGNTLGGAAKIIGNLAGATDSANKEIDPKKVDQTEGKINKSLKNASHSLLEAMMGNSPVALGFAGAPPVSASLGAGGKSTHVNVNQNLHFQHEGKDHKKTADSVKKANQDAFRQYSQGEVN